MISQPQWLQISTGVLGVFLLTVIGKNTFAAETRLSSPKTKFDILFRPIDLEAAKKIAAVKDSHEAVRTQYRIEFWMSGSSTTVSRYDSLDADPPPAPADILNAMLWSADEHFVVVPAMPKAQLGSHVMYDLITLDGSDRVLEFEADHVRWLNPTHLIGDVNTKQAPGGIIVIDAAKRDAHIILAPLTGIGYQLIPTSGPAIQVKEILNDQTSDKTTWEHFTPACLTLDPDTLKKRLDFLPLNLT